MVSKKLIVYPLYKWFNILCFKLDWQPYNEMFLFKPVIYYFQTYFYFHSFFCWLTCLTRLRWRKLRKAIRKMWPVESTLEATSDRKPNPIPEWSFDAKSFCRIPRNRNDEIRPSKRHSCSRNSLIKF